jgi:hypothetical protein
VVNAGVENLSVKGGSDGALNFASAAYSWAKNVKVTQWTGAGVQINSSFREEVRDSYIHQGSWPEPGGGGYAISMANGSSEALIENNVMTDANKVMVFRSSGTGSVVGYNYTDDGWIWDTQGWVEVGINASHMAGPHHGGFAIPNLLYLQSAPAFFGTNPWPWVNPTNGSLASLPAKTRFDNGIYFCNDGC